MLRSTQMSVSLLLACGVTAAHAGTTIAVRVLPSSTFTDNPCNAPCQCIIDPIPRPIAGRMLFATSPSIPEISALRGAFRCVDPQFPDVSLSGEAVFTTHNDPALLSRLTLDTSYGQATWLLDSGFFTPMTEFPNMSIALNTAQSDCTTLRMHLDLIQTCIADFDNGSGSGVPDSAVTIDDLLFYVGAFETGNAIADIDSVFSDQIPDQAVTIEDLLAFLDHFESGC